MESSAAAAVVSLDGVVSKGSMVMDWASPE